MSYLDFTLISLLSSFVSSLLFYLRMRHSGISKKDIELLGFFSSLKRSIWVNFVPFINALTPFYFIIEMAFKLSSRYINKRKRKVIRIKTSKLKKYLDKRDLSHKKMDKIRAILIENKGEFTTVVMDNLNIVFDLVSDYEKRSAKTRIDIDKKNSEIKAIQDAINNFMKLSSECIILQGQSEKMLDFEQYNNYTTSIIEDIEEKKAIFIEK